MFPSPQKLFANEKKRKIEAVNTCFLTNGRSGYLALGKHTESKYQGSFFSDGNTLFRFLEDTRINNETAAIKIRQHGETAFRSWKNEIEEAFRYHGNTILYERRGKAATTLFLDGKQSYDDREFGRIYEVEQHIDGILIHFRKANDAAENQPGGEYGFTIFLKLSPGHCELLKNWEPHVYEYDRQREKCSGERYIFALLATEAVKFTLSVGKTSEEATKESLLHSAFFEQKTTLFEHNNCSINTSPYNAATSAIRGLVGNMYGRTGILAGLPWFFQYWTRDEAISARSLTLIGEEETAKNILLNLLKAIDKDGRIPNRIPSSDLSCADGVGWVFYRLKELFIEARLLKSEEAQVTKAICSSLFLLEKTCFQDGLIRNQRLETWMDTVCKNDDRAGFRIEIQALTLAMYDFALLLTGDLSWQEKSARLKSRVVETFWNGTILCDGKDDATVRPNIFITFYVYPQLLSKKEWLRAFDSALAKLWLPWGGLATIAKDHPLFQEHYTGQDNRSYHRGDSWYFLNNLAAIAMQRLDKNRYRSFIEAIYTASVKDIQELGAIGCCSEISSAVEQASEGCWNQAWSNALFIELCHEIGNSI